MNLFKSSNLSTVARLSFRKNYYFHADGNIHFQIIAADEFQNPLSIIKLSKLEFLYQKVNSNGNEINSEKCVVIACKIDQKYIVYVELKKPLFVGQYKISIHPQILQDGTYILPLISSSFNMIEGIEDKVHHGEKILNNDSLIVTRYFPIPSSDKSVLIYEEYGHCLGSHCWDSSIILLRAIYINENNNVNNSIFTMNRDICLDLGAGTGIVGLWMHYLYNYKSTILTDKKELIPLLQNNIKLNNNSNSNSNDTIVLAKELDWSNTDQINQIIQEYDHLLDTIIAADVLYDPEASQLLFSLLKKICTLTTVVYLAQRLRSTDPLNPPADVNSLCGDILEAVLIHQEAGVAVYKINRMK